MRETPASSRKMVTSRAGWLGMARDEESRAYLQQRLNLLSKLMFWSFLALMLFLAGAYVRYPDLAPEHNVVIFGTGATGLAVMGGTLAFVAAWFLGRALAAARDGRSGPAITGGALGGLCAIGSAGCLAAASVFAILTRLT